MALRQPAGMMSVAAVTGRECHRRHSYSFTAKQRKWRSRAALTMSGKARGAGWQVSGAPVNNPGKCGRRGRDADGAIVRRPGGPRRHSARPGRSCVGPRCVSGRPAVDNGGGAKCRGDGADRRTVDRRRFARAQCSELDTPH